MRLSRVLVFSGLLSMICLLFAACGGGGPAAMPTQPLMVTTASPLPQGTVNNSYTYHLNATGGSGAYTWSIVSGSLPMGLMIDTHGTITGSPTTFGNYSFTAQVTDTASHTASANLSIPIEGALVITCNSCAMGTLNLPAGMPGSPYSATLSAIGGQTPYTWCVVESSGTCDDGSGGALPAGLTIATDANNNGVISGTPMSQPAQPLPIVVQVKDSETIAASGSVTVTLIIFSVATKTLPNGTLEQPYKAANGQPVMVIEAGGVQPFTWALTDGSLPPGLTFGPCMHLRTPSCPITGIPTQVGTSTFTVSVTDSETPPVTATQQLSIDVVPAVTNSLLNGNFAIAFSGYSNGTPFILAGAFSADGQGNITSGVVDRNDGSGEINDPSQCGGNPNCPIPETIQTGSAYDLSAGSGLGTVTLETLDQNHNPHSYEFSIAVSGNACTPGQPSLSACGRLIQRDPNNPHTYGSGVLKIQDPAKFSINAFFPGNFAVLLNGFDANGNRYAAAGALGTNPVTMIDIDCNGNGWHLGGCPLSVNDNGNAGSNPIAGSQFAANIDPQTGRGEFVNMRFPGDPNGYCLGGTGHPNCGYAYYIVDGQEMILISSDPFSKPANLTLWTAYRQKSFATGWTLQQLSGPAITQSTANAGGSADVIAGILTADGAGNATFNGDQNEGGLTFRLNPSGTYSIDSAGNKTGNFTLNFPLFGPNGGSVYLYTGNAGFFLGTDTAATSGSLEGQSGAPFSNSSVIGSLAGGTTWPAVIGVTNSVEEMFADGGGNISAVEYTSNPISGPIDLTLTYHVDSTGRAEVINNGQEIGILYVIGPKKFLLLPYGGNPALSVFISGQAD